MASRKVLQPTEVNAASPSTVAMPAKLLMATGQGNCERLKDMLNSKDATAMVVVMAPGNQAATEEKQPAALKTINPVLLALACCGDSVGLDYLLNNREDAAAVRAPTAQAQQILGNLAGYPYASGNAASSQHAAACDDVEEGGAGLLPALSASSLLEGVTDEGDTALHAVATCGDDESFLESAGIIYGKENRLLSEQNSKGDTPVHCAARARKSKMVSRLIDLARGSGAAGAGVKSLLEMENKLKETALHEAVRVGDEDMVERLMKEDSELAGFPKNGGASPLYLAILLENEAIVDKLYERSSSGRSLSYSGPNGQNALHAAALRGPGNLKSLAS